VICKLAANSPNVQDRGFHSTPVWGSLGAAVACASLLKLNAAQLKAALGIAASAAGGIHRQQGSMAKPFHAGNGARNGAEAALLARSGFTADSAIIEAPRGFCDTFFGPATCNFDKMIENIGQPFFFGFSRPRTQMASVQRTAIFGRGCVITLKTRARN
jgi:2-methylcitrate dehydratase PrpD